MPDKPTPAKVDGVTRLRKWGKAIDRSHKAAETGTRHVPEADPDVPGVNPA